jgi:peptidoglycan hydrolase FlgJ
MSAQLNSVVAQMGSSQSVVASRSESMLQDSPVATSPAERKLRSAAAEFESLLLSNLWKSMKSSFAAPDDESADPAHETLDDWGIQAMSSAVGKAGGLGIGKLILKHLEPLLANSPKKEG